VIEAVGQPVDFIWHAIPLEQLRCRHHSGGFPTAITARRALARFSPVMNSVKEFAARELVLGSATVFKSV